MKIIDLSVPLNENTPPFPGDPLPKVEPAAVVERDGYCDHNISMATHVGTHIDAPSHMIKDGINLDKVPVEQFIGRGRLIKVDGKYDLEIVKNADIQEGDIVFFWTGMTNKYHLPEYFEKYPPLPAEIAQYLVDKKVKMIGFDAASPDYEPFDVHKLILSNNVLIAENLTNLDKLESQEFEVIALPINLQIDGAPARVIARCN